MVMESQKQKTSNVSISLAGDSMVNLNSDSDDTEMSINDEAVVNSNSDRHYKRKDVNDSQNMGKARRADAKATSENIIEQNAKGRIQVRQSTEMTNRSGKKNANQSGVNHRNKYGPKGTDLQIINEVQSNLSRSTFKPYSQEKSNSNSNSIGKKINNMGSLRDKQHP